MLTQLAPLKAVKTVQDSESCIMTNVLKVIAIE